MLDVPYWEDYFDKAFLLFLCFSCNETQPVVIIIYHTRGHATECMYPMYATSRLSICDVLDYYSISLYFVIHHYDTSIIL